MLILVLLLLAQSQAQVTPPPSDDVVVTGERLRRFNIDTKTDRKTGVRRCVIKRDSGDPRFNARMCDAMLVCAAKVTTAKQMEACMQPPIDAFFRELRAARATSTAPAGIDAVPRSAGTEPRPGS